jgi:hypothetical protein
MQEAYYEDKYSEMWIENGIGYQVYKSEAVITLDIAKKMVAKRIESFNGIARPVYVDVRNLLSIDNDSRKYFASREAGALILAGAIHLDNPINQFFGNIFLLVDRPITPAKLFTNKDKALHWLQQFKHMN